MRRKERIEYTAPATLITPPAKMTKDYRKGYQRRTPMANPQTRNMPLAELLSDALPALIICHGTHLA
ncbi:MAG: hypothetical protein KKD01_05645 [Proteobacteria bacterium]|nr:hypothetical protein [Pseudomonadota bacterium]MBU1139499.1 hypothetical protein [Pseudomonadota bacterium]MBU1231373.1 hypothetical protein [Pseudomonadota bacterium]MBU1418596.1 hypothetical protein [Pseudomonadota bacterium]MBU1454194.1 hypothetical protein [Pseudomonadota bacterium]